MGVIKVIHDRKGETLTVYWEEPSVHQICEETGEGVILIKDERTGEVIGFERLHYRPDSKERRITVEAVEVAIE